MSFAFVVGLDPQPVAAYNPPISKIIHIDMDCFYAAIEIRDNPSLRGKPVAVGGTSEERGVLTTCSYEAREFGCHSAMPTYLALRRCPDLVLVPVRFDVYRKESQVIRAIFRRFTDLVEPLSLDEAYLDVTRLNSSGAAIAREIRDDIKRETSLSASAGIAPSKFLAKVASDWKKPDGQFEITEEEIREFVGKLAVEKIWGVGKATAKRIHSLGVETCGELQGVPLSQLTHLFGKFGLQLHQLCRGIDEREVEPHRERKSLSNEETFAANLTSFEECFERLTLLYAELVADYQAKHSTRTIHKAFVKMKFSDFTTTTAECRLASLGEAPFVELLEKAWKRGNNKPVRLLGTGIRFAPAPGKTIQLEMFDGCGERG
ncbi:MAG: DNA polymerase IV [Verrucomicrobiales bacterium]